MHAGGEAKGIRIKNRVVWVEEVVHSVEHGTRLTRSGRRYRGRGGERRVLRERHRRLHALALHPPGRGIVLGERARAGGVVAGVFVFEHVGLLFVLLVCAHGISLGRTKL
jgi:hypothetical protein